ncbi:MAG: GNAT family protein [Acidobacteria bacterium]|nr:GNAT family protein [Acidobacteriota bacterium]
MKAPVRVETSRLAFSPPTASDAGDVFNRYAGDVEVTRYLGWPTHRSVTDTEAFIAFSADQWERDGAGPYLIRALDDGRLIGSTGLALEAGGAAMTGYVLAKDAWGKGYATEALRAMVEVASGISVVRIYALCHPQHRASWHVLEKCGFQRDAGRTAHMEFPNLARGVPQDVLSYARRLRPEIGG